MRVFKWGDRLGVRLPGSVVEAFDLKEGDEVEIRVAGERVLEVAPDEKRSDALARLRKLRRPLPPGFSFDREDASVR